MLVFSHTKRGPNLLFSGKLNPLSSIWVSEVLLSHLNQTFHWSASRMPAFHYVLVCYVKGEYNIVTVDDHNLITIFIKKI
jgi:hypothetical protein